MALQGTLDTFALADVLRLLATTAKTGRLRVEGDRGQGSVWLRDGTVMAAAADRAIDGAPSEEVLFELLRFQDGSFDFAIDELSPNGEQPEDVEVLLRDANALVGEWNDLEKVVPSLDHRVTLVESLPGDDVTIHADHWPTVVAVGTGRSVRELAAALTLGELGVSRKVRDLVDLGVVELGEPSADAGRNLDAAPPPDPATRTAGPRIPTRSARTALRRAEAQRPDQPVPAAPSRRGGPFADLGSGEVLGTPGAARNDTGELERLGWLQHDSGSQPQVPDNGANGAGRANGADSLNAGPANRLTPPGGSPSVPGKPSGKRAGRAGKRASSNGRSGSRRSTLPGSAAGADDVPVPPATPPAGTPPLPAGTPPLPSSSPSSPSSPRLNKGRSGSRRSSSRPPSAPPAGGPGAGGPGAGSPFESGPTMSSPFDSGTTPIVRPFDTGGVSLPPLYEAGSLGAAPLPADTGQIRPVSPSSLPSDLRWAADDGRTGSPFGGPSGPAVPAPSMPPGPAPAPLEPGKVAPHVAAMSPEARAAVQNTVGNHGGTNGGPAIGEELADRGQLLNFLSSVRP